MHSISITKKEHFKLFSKILSVYYDSHKDLVLKVYAILVYNFTFTLNG
jgi:hypothetical protein